MKRTIVPALLMLGAFALAGCDHGHPRTNEIRHEAAKATAEAEHDVKAVAHDIKKDIGSKTSSVNINHASESDLKALPGVGAHTAHRIIAARPYDSAHDLVKRHLISQTEYDRISGKIVAD
jgi:DNA uptake protein ComE-like DNA-binding protein